jgi:mannose-6-phosphate isomerase-like protein (cupin superfamily)
MRHSEPATTADLLVDFSASFARLAAAGLSEESTRLGGVDVRLVRVEGGGGGARRWDSHDESTETVVVWRGTFQVEFRDRTVRLVAGQCCVVPVSTEHRGTSPDGAEIVLFRQGMP